MCWSLSHGFDGDLQSCHNPPAHRRSSLVPQNFHCQVRCVAVPCLPCCSNSLSSRRQLRATSHQHVQDRLGVATTFLSLLSMFRCWFTSTVWQRHRQIHLSKFHPFLRISSSVLASSMFFPSISAHDSPDLSRDFKLACSFCFSLSYFSRSLQHWRTNCLEFVRSSVSAFVTRCPSNHPMVQNCTRHRSCPLVTVVLFFDPTHV